jgi:small subunit ribosomal protein S24e
MGKTIQIGEFNGEVISEKDNPLIKRKELIVRIGHIGKSTPSRGLIRHEIARIYNVEPELVYVRGIKTEYGMGVTEAEVHIYSSVERAKLFEPKHVLKRNEYASQSYQLEKMMQEQSGG